MEVVLISIGILIVIVIFRLVQGSKKKKEVIKKMGMSPEDFISTEKLIHGHPDIDETYDMTDIALINDALTIFEVSVSKIKELAKIPTNQIKNIIIENASTVEKRVTAGRLLALGVFAFAAKKKEVNEMSYLVIDWNDGRFDHSTIFEFTGQGSLEKSNTARNYLVKKLR